MKNPKSIISLLLVFAAFLGGPVHSREDTVYGVVKFFGADLRATPEVQSAVVVSVPAGEKTEYLQNSGPFWWKVRWSGQEGWLLRALVEKMTDEEIAAAQAPVDSSNTAAAGKAVLAPIPPGTGRALVLGLSNYALNSGIPSLPGVPVDMISATSMAQMMGISADRVSVQRDQALNKTALSALLTQLALDVQPEEPVLIYYSGHGGRVDDPVAAGRCIEGLITYEGQLLTANEMADLLRPIAQKTGKLFVFIDACHSGGLSTTRAIGEAELRPKFFAKSGSVSNCSEIVNMLAEQPALRATGKEWVYAGAARHDEISLDDARTGGLATSNWLRCMAKADNKSSVEELRACTQQAINARVQNSKIYKPQNMTLTGDLSTAPMRANLTPEVKQGLVANSSLVTAGESTESAKSFNLQEGLVKKGMRVPNNLDEALKNILAGSKKTADLSVNVPAQVKINGAPLSAKISVKDDSYLYVFYRSSDRKGLTLLFPNALDKDNLIKAGTAFSLPRADWPLVAGGPEGQSQLLVVSSRYPRDIAQLVGQMNDPFFEVAVSPLGGQAFNLGLSRTAFEQDESCQKAARAKRGEWCDAPYSAVIKGFREVR